jgi:hypothetical protein
MTDGTVSPIEHGKKPSARDQAIEAAGQSQKEVSERKADRLLALALEKWRPGRTETGSPMAVPLNGAPSAIIVGDKMGDTFKDNLAHLGDPITLPIDLVLRRLRRVRGARARGFMAECPAHPDRVPSLSIAEGQDGRVLVHCFAGCDTSAVLAAIGVSFRDLFARR